MGAHRWHLVFSSANPHIPHFSPSFTPLLTILLMLSASLFFLFIFNYYAHAASRPSRPSVAFLPLITSPRHSGPVAPITTITLPGMRYVLSAAALMDVYHYEFVRVEGGMRSVEFMIKKPYASLQDFEITPANVEIPPPQISTSMSSSSPLGTNPWDVVVGTNPILALPRWHAKYTFPDNMLTLINADDSRVTIPIIRLGKEFAFTFSYNGRQYEWTSHPSNIGDMVCWLKSMDPRVPPSRIAELKIFQGKPLTWTPPPRVKVDPKKRIQERLQKAEIVMMQTLLPGQGMERLGAVEVVLATAFAFTKMVREGNDAV